MLILLEAIGMVQYLIGQGQPTMSKDRKPGRGCMLGGGVSMVHYPCNLHKILKTRWNFFNKVLDLEVFGFLLFRRLSQNRFGHEEVYLTLALLQV